MVEGAMIALGKEMAKDTVTNATSPFLKKALVWWKYNLEPKSVHFKKYKMMMQARFECINNPIMANSKIKLDDVFVPQTFVVEDSQQEVLIDKLPFDLIKHYKNLIIKDTAGRGKSTLMKKMFLWCIDEGHYPVFVDLRNLKKDHLILDELLKNLGEYNEKFDFLLLQKFLDDGYLIFFLDGFDEVAAEDCSEVAKDINDLVGRADKNIFILTSRDDDRLAGFSSFKGIRLKDFTLEESYQLIRKYGRNTKKAQEIIEVLESGALDDVKEFLRSPLHTTLFYGAYQYGRPIPVKIHEVCRDIYKALFDEHDLSKDAEFLHKKKCSLSESDFERVLGFIGIYCLSKGIYEINIGDISQVLNLVRAQCPDLNFSDEDLLYDISISLSVFRKTRTTYLWIHEMMCHYFTARSLSQVNQESVSSLLQKIYFSPNLERFIPMLRIYSELSPVDFRKEVMLELLREYQKHYAECLKCNFTGISNDSRDARAYMLFDRSVDIEYIHSEWKVKASPTRLKPLLTILYENNSEIFGKLDLSKPSGSLILLNEGEIVHLKMDSFSKNQKEYNDCNIMVAQSIGDDRYLIFAMVQIKMKEYKEDNLKDLINLNYGI